VAKAKAKKRIVFMEQTDEDVTRDIRIGIPEGGRFWNYLIEVTTERPSSTEQMQTDFAVAYAIGKCAGRADLAEELITRAMSEDDETEVKKNLEEDHAP
jgi:hypothetical protein